MNRAPDKLRICVFYAMKTAVLIMSSMIPLTILSLDTDETVRNLSIEFSVARLFMFLLIECTHYAYILLCKQTFQIRSVLVQSCT
jgi:hypothetical protein